MRHKRLLCCLTVVLALSLVAFFALTGGTAQTKLSDLADEALVLYLTDAGVRIPDHNVDIDTIRGILTSLEEDPNQPEPVLNWTPIVDMFEDIRTVVKDYYGIK